MHATVTKDNTRRTVKIDIVDGPMLETTKPWYTSPKYVEVDRALILVDNGAPRSITVSGWTLLKNGSLSDSTRDDLTWHSDTGYTYKIADAPGWVQKLFHQAVNGVTTWTDQQLGLTTYPS
jgi:hypothetical protein